MSGKTKVSRILKSFIYVLVVSLIVQVFADTKVNNGKTRRTAYTSGPLSHVRLKFSLSRKFITKAEYNDIRRLVSKFYNITTRTLIISLRLGVSKKYPTKTLKKIKRTVNKQLLTASTAWTTGSTTTTAFTITTNYGTTT